MIDIKKLREAKGLTQKELADRCGVTLRTIQNWDSGKNIPKSVAALLELLVFPTKDDENISSFAAGGSVSVAAAQGSRVNVSKSRENTETDKFLSVLERQQELMFEQMKANNKRAEQIDRLLTLLENKG